MSDIGDLPSHARTRILEAVLDAIDEVNDQLPVDQRIPRDEAARLAGTDGQLDSLGLVNLIVATEQKVADALGVPIVLTDAADLFEPDGPGASVRQLTDHIALLLLRSSHD
jgi:acyl carrier protein